MALRKIPTRPSTPISNPVGVSGPIITERSEFKGSGTTRPAAIPARQITPEQIERRAYEIYASRGYAPGDPVADWYEAERQLKAGL